MPKKWLPDDLKSSLFTYTFFCSNSKINNATDNKNLMGNSKGVLGP
jgi:hypothetical protein